MKLSQGSVRAKDRRLFTAQRIVLLGFQVQRELEDAEATWGVFSWVAWAEDRRPALTRRRADIALHLRRRFDRPQNGWFPSHQLAAALRAWEEQIELARAEHRPPPGVDDVPDDVYAAAVATASTKPRKTSRREPLAPVAPAQPPQPNEEQLLTMLASALYRFLRRGGNDEGALAPGAV